METQINIYYHLCIKSLKFPAADNARYTVYTYKCLRSSNPARAGRLKPNLGVKICSDCSFAKVRHHGHLEARITSLSYMTLKTEVPCRSRSDTSKNPHSLKLYRSKFAALSPVMVTATK
jgi:hypothetical protein